MHEEALVAGLAGGIGFMYFVFEYAGRPPMPTIVAQAHPEPWVQVALGRLNIPYEATRSAKPRWNRVEAALDAGAPVFCTVDRSALPWHGPAPMAELAAADPYVVVVVGREGDTYHVEDGAGGARAPYEIGREEFGAAWSGHKKGRHQMVVTTGKPAGEPDLDAAIAATVSRLTGPVLGNHFDVNFGFSGMEKFAAQLRDTSTKAGWERRFATPEAFALGAGRLYACLEEEWTAPAPPGRCTRTSSTSPGTGTRPRSSGSPGGSGRGSRTWPVRRTPRRTPPGDGRSSTPARSSWTEPWRWSGRRPGCCRRRRPSPPSRAAGAVSKVESINF